MILTQTTIEEKTSFSTQYVLKGPVQHFSNSVHIIYSYIYLLRESMVKEATKDRKQ